MKVTLEKGEVLDVALVENDRIVGTLSLELKNMIGSGISASRSVSAPASSSASESSSSSSPSSSSSSGRRGRRGPRQLSPEARAKMAEAQRRRWAKARAEKGK